MMLSENSCKVLLAKSDSSMSQWVEEPVFSHHKWTVSLSAWVFSEDLLSSENLREVNAFAYVFKQ